MRAARLTGVRTDHGLGGAKVAGRFEVILTDDFAVVAGSTDATVEKCGFGPVVHK